MLAHQGGWDEILLVLGPIAIIVGLLMLAKKRVTGAQGSGAQGSEAQSRSRTTDAGSPHTPQP